MAVVLVSSIVRTYHGLTITYAGGYERYAKKVLQKKGFSINPFSFGDHSKDSYLFANSVNSIVLHRNRHTPLQKGGRRRGRNGEYGAETQ